MMQKTNIKSWVLFLALPLAVGALSALLTRGNMMLYQTIETPPFAPPSILFPIVCTVLYLLMGVSAKLVADSGSPDREAALAVYYLQLIVNFFWSILFFNKRAFFISFLWLVLLWVLILVMIVRFHRIRPVAGLLQLPYLAWVTFAGVLNFSIYLLNR